MGRKKKISEQVTIWDIILFVLATLIIFLKWTGDGVIFLGKAVSFFLSKSYNFFWYPFSQLIKSIKLTNLKVKKPTRREKVIFRSKKSPFLHLRIKFKLKKLPLVWRLFFLKIKYFFLGGVFMAVLSLGFLLYLQVVELPNPALLTMRDIPATTKIYDRNGKLLYEIYAEENRTPLKLVDIPQRIKQATIAIEDAEFFRHKGISWRGIARALLHNLNSSDLEGGSTITQQLVRSVLLTSEKTLSRKIKEVVLAAWAEHLYTKEQILEMYLNQVPYGGTAWGIEAAAQTYFGKSVADLSLGQAALLAGLPASPTRFSPFGSNPTLVKVRQLEVLRQMVANGYISREEAEQATAQPLNLRRPVTPILAPHFVMYVKDILEAQYGQRMVERGGLHVTTSLDLSLQEMAQKAVTKEIENLRNLNVGNGAVLITNPTTGEILSMVGSVDYFDKDREGNVNVPQSLRQPGSSIKVVNYAAALAHGFTAASLLDDSPISYRAINQFAYTPVNYDGRFHGQITLRVALASSYNVPAVKVLNKIGVDTMIGQGRLMGITTWEDKKRFGLSLTLGGGDVTMLDMAKVYGTLANNGNRVDLMPIIKVTNLRGDTLSLPVIKNEVQATSAGVAYILSSILSDNSARSSAFGPNSALFIPGKTVAVKTGTSDNKRDNWTIGYTPEFVVVVWVGNNNNTPMNPQLTSGVTGAAPIWHEIMSDLLKEKEDKSFIIPDDVVGIPCFSRIEYFIRGTEPIAGCPRFIPISSNPSPTP